MLIKRGDIFWARLDNFSGTKFGGARPVLVVQDDILNKHARTVIVVPITSSP